MGKVRVTPYNGSYKWLRAPAPVGETCAWELMLAERGLTEAAVLANAALVADWVRLRHRSAFVPEGVLDALGLRPREICEDGCLERTNGRRVHAAKMAGL